MSVRTIDLAIEMKKLQALAEDGELTPEMIADTLEGLEGMLGDKLDATMSVVRDFNANADKCDAEAKRLAERKKMWGNQGEMLKKYILDCMVAAGGKSVKTATNTFSVRKGLQRLIIDDEDQLPDAYVISSTKIVNEVKSDELKKALIAGTEDIKGAHLETGPQSLGVR